MQLPFVIKAIHTFGHLKLIIFIFHIIFQIHVWQLITK